MKGPRKVCWVEGCDKTAHANGMCTSHSRLNDRNGSPHIRQRQLIARAPIAQPPPADGAMTRAQEMAHLATARMDQRTPTTLYRLFDADDQLIYVGIAGNPGRRFEQHRTDKPWWGQVTTIRLEHFDHRKQAEEAELRVIITEQPPMNDIGLTDDGEVRCWNPLTPAAPVEPVRIQPGELSKRRKAS